MPEVSRFLGIIIRKYCNEHQPPHFHAIYGEYSAEFNIETLELLEGELPRRVTALVIEWAALHRYELRQNWKLARAQQALLNIEPLT